MRVMDCHEKINKEELIKESFKSSRINNRINLYGMEYLDQF